MTAGEHEALAHDDPDEQFPSGTVLGSYRVVGKIGRGGMGDVYEVEHVKLGRRLALKLLRRSVTVDAEAVKRFFGEARAVANIGHPNLIEVTDLVEEGEHTYYVMELLQGQNLAEHLRDGPLPLGELLSVGGQICAALDALHEDGVIHRDVKPENVFLQKTSRGRRAKLIDLGVAKLRKGIDSGKVVDTVVGSIVGTPAYMSPEQAAGRPADHRADIYSLGVLLYEALAGALPFDGNSFGDYLVAHMTLEPILLAERCDRDVPPEIERLIFDCLAKEPADRPASAAEVSSRLEDALWSLAETDEAVLDEESGPAGFGPPFNRPPRPTPDMGSSPPELATSLPARQQRRTGAAPVALGIAALVIAAAVGLLLFGDGEGEGPDDPALHEHSREATEPPAWQVAHQELDGPREPEAEGEEATAAREPQARPAGSAKAKRETDERAVSAEARPKRPQAKAAARAAAKRRAEARKRRAGERAKKAREVEERASKPSERARPDPPPDEPADKDAILNPFQ